MKQRHIVGRILYALLAVFVVFYIGGVVWRAVYDPVKTVSAVHMVAEDSIEVDGLVVREEKTLDAVTSGTIEMQIGEGERAAKGDAVAHIYANASDLDKMHKKKELANRIAKLDTLMNQGNEVVDLGAVDASITQMGESVLDSYAQGDFSRIPAMIEQIKDKTMSREYIYRDRTELKGIVDGLKKELKGYGNPSPRKIIYATAPGYYSNESDGFEGVLACSKLSDLSPKKYQEIQKKDAISSQNDGTLGKIVTEFYWDYVALVDEETAGRMPLGDMLMLSFESPQYPSVTAMVKWKSDPVDGKVTVALRSTEHISDFTVARKLRASIIIHSYEGLKVPREALRVNEEGVKGVFCLINSQVKFKPVLPIFEKDSYYIVQYDSADTKSLLLFDEIIVSAKDLEDKKMVK